MGNIEKILRLEIKQEMDNLRNLMDNDYLPRKLAEKQISLYSLEDLQSVLLLRNQVCKILPLLEICNSFYSSESLKRMESHARNLKRTLGDFEREYASYKKQINTFYNLGLKLPATLFVNNAHVILN